MDWDGFWTLIEQCREHSTKCLPMARHLRKQLSKLPAEEIDSFYGHFHEALDDAYRADLWDVANIVLDRCSEGTFLKFRGWLIAQGRGAYEAMMKSPGRVIEFAPDDEDAVCVPILYAAGEAYHDKTGSWDIPAHKARTPRTLERELLDDEGLRERYPELWGKFRGR